jgi:2-keto-4-pentenoate hydratase/2-oxohepta-3-ene-1,7-dioic acid hydratase in catechol pathway
VKIARFEYQNSVHIGVLNQTGDALAPIAIDAPGGDPMIALLERLLAGAPPPEMGSPVALAEVRLLSPIARPSKNVLCIGKNYAAHAAEFSRSGYDATAKQPSDYIPEAPIIFSKAAGCLVGAHDEILPPWSATQEVDYEAELGVIIGKGGRNIARADAYRHVFGYTCINDVTARDMQAKHKQWLLGKSIDTFCPMGPWIVTADEVDPANMEVRCWVNGELRQDANTRDLIFDIPAIIETISTSMTLQPGDIIATGTPAGVGIGFSPPRFLRTGDVVRIEISGVGEICNTVR